MLAGFKPIFAATALSIAAVSFYAHGKSLAGSDTPIDVGAAAGPVLAELFTSQGCSSCPPAEAFFASLADTPSVVTIEWHVDYWDTLVHHGTRWKDPFSSADNTSRQRRYNEALRGTSGNYTPQAVIAGRYEAVGSSRSQINRRINAAPASRATLETTRHEAGYTVAVTADGTLPSSDVVFVRLLQRQSTSVERGENAGRTLSGAHIALERISLGRFSGGTASFEAPALNKGETCAIFIQESGERLGPVHGAGYCPT